MNELIVVPLSTEFELDGIKLPKFPFVMDKYGNPHVIINRFLRDHHVFQKKNDSELTILAAARNIVSSFNQLSQTFISSTKVDVGVEISERTKITSSFMNHDLDLDFEFDLYGDDFHRTWLTASDSLIQLMLNNSEQTSPNLSTTHNRRMGDFICFLWWAEKNKYSHWLTGINDRGIHGDKEFSVALGAKKNKYHEYSNPHQLVTEGSSRKKGNGVRKRFDDAYTKLYSKKDSSASPKKMAIHYRNLLILRIIREGALRNTEDITLQLSQFEGEPEYNTDGSRVWIRTTKTKGKGKPCRNVKIPTMLDQQIRKFIKIFRKQILPKKMQGIKPSSTDPVFPSQMTGKALMRTSVNGIFSDYGISPHQGRMLSISEMAMGMIKQGLNEGDILLLLAEHAGHSSRTDGSTIRKHYLDALCDLDAMTRENPVTLKCALNDAESELEKLRRENEELKGLLLNNTN